MRAITVKQALGLSIALHGVLMVIIFFKLHHPVHSKTFAVAKQVAMIKAALYTVKPKPISTSVSKEQRRVKLPQKKATVKPAVSKEKSMSAAVKSLSRRQQKAQKLQHGDSVNKVLKAVFSQILKHRYYPMLAKRRHHQGSVLLTLVVDSLGRVTQLLLTQSSGYRELDQAAVTAVKKAQPFPNAQSLAGKKIVIPMKYSLNG